MGDKRIGGKRAETEDPGTSVFGGEKAERAAKKTTIKAKFAQINKINGTKWQAFKYFLCTISAGLIELISFVVLDNALVKFIDPYEKITFITTVAATNFIATTTALALSILWNFTLNRKVTFKSAGNIPAAMFLTFLFYVPFYPFKIWFNGILPGAAVANAAANAEMSAANYLLKYPLIKTAFEAMSMLCNGVLEFLWQKFVVYRKSANTAVKKGEKPETAQSVRNVAETDENPGG